MSKDEIQNRLKYFIFIHSKKRELKHSLNNDLLSPA